MSTSTYPAVSLPTSSRVGERWRAVVGFEGLYEVSDLGRVRGVERSFKDKNGVDQRRGERVLAPGLTGKGYRLVVLRKDGKSFTRTVHLLVAHAWVRNPAPAVLREVDHEDRNRTRNAATNLRWSTRAINCINRQNAAGVSFDPRLKKPWVAYVGTFWRERFSTEGEALSARAASLARILSNFYQQYPSIVL